MPEKDLFTWQIPSSKMKAFYKKYALAGISFIAFFFWACAAMFWDQGEKLAAKSLVLVGLGFVLLAILVYLYYNHKDFPGEQYKITSQGIFLEHKNKFYPWLNLKSYYLRSEFVSRNKIIMRFIPDPLLDMPFVAPENTIVIIMKCSKYTEIEIRSLSSDFASVQKLIAQYLSKADLSKDTPG